MKGHPTIRMVSETVRCEVPSGRVRAVFVFRNDGPATTVRMGFPEEGWARRLPRHGSTMEGFRTYVDGVRMNVRREQAKGIKWTEDGDNAYSAWWVKHVPFAAGQTRTVVDEYVGGMGFNTVGDEFFHYVLKTGANWHGPIGSARIFVDFRKLFHVSRPDCDPPGAVVKGGIAKWHFEKIEPKFDIDVEWYHGFAAIEVNGKALSKEERYRTFPDDSMGEFWRGDVWLPVYSVGRLLGADVRMTQRGKAVELSRAGKVVRLRVGQRPQGRGYRGNRAVMFDKRDFRFRVLLGDCVRILGGKMRYDRKHDRMIVTLR